MDAQPFSVQSGLLHQPGIRTTSHGQTTRKLPSLVLTRMSTVPMRVREGVADHRSARIASDNHWPRPPDRYLISATNKRPWLSTMSQE